MACPDTHQHPTAQSRTGFWGNPSGNSSHRGCGWCLRPTPVTFCCPNPLHRSLVHGASHLQRKTLAGIRFGILILGLSLIEDKGDKKWGAGRHKGSSWDLGDGSCLLSSALSLQRPAEGHKPCRGDGAGAGLGDIFIPKGSEAGLHHLQDLLRAPAWGRTWSLPSLCPSGCELSCSSEPAAFIRATPTLNNSL